MGGSRPSACLSLWERGPSKARTERVHGEEKQDPLSQPDGCQLSHRESQEAFSSLFSHKKASTHKIAGACSCKLSLGELGCATSEAPAALRGADVPIASRLRRNRRGTTMKAARQKKQAPTKLQVLAVASYLLENWGARRAAFKPYFFLSFILGSRVRKPAAFRAARYSGLTFSRARETP